MSDTQLLPCGYCGSDAEITIDRHGYRYAGCRSLCGVNPMTEGHTNDEGASIQWNTRHITLPQAKQVLAEAGMVAVPTEANEELLNKFLTHGGLTQVLTPAGLRAAYEFMIKAAQDKPDA